VIGGVRSDSYVVLPNVLGVMKDYVPLSDRDYTPTEYGDLQISIDEFSVARKLRAVSISRACGPDDLPNGVLREFADILAAPVTDILNSSFAECKVPRVWKLANIPPIPKATIIRDFNHDLRLISLTSTLSKIAESYIIEKSLKPTVLPSIDHNQYGFIPGSSTTLALIYLHHILALPLHSYISYISIISLIS
jgi:hypothetical protein